MIIGRGGAKEKLRGNTSLELFTVWVIQFAMILAWSRVSRR
jgi:hypothetical protein